MMILRCQWCSRTQQKARPENMLLTNAFAEDLYPLKWHTRIIRFSVIARRSHRNTKQTQPGVEHVANRSRMCERAASRRGHTHTHTQASGPCGLSNSGNCNTTQTYVKLWLIFRGVSVFIACGPGSLAARLYARPLWMPKCARIPTSFRRHWYLTRPYIKRPLQSPNLLVMITNTHKMFLMAYEC